MYMYTYVYLNKIYIYISITSCLCQRRNRSMVFHLRWKDNPWRKTQKLQDPVSQDWWRELWSNGGKEIWENIAFSIAMVIGKSIWATRELEVTGR